MTAWLTIASGVIGLLAIACLLTAVMTRDTWSLSSRVYLLFRAHDLGVTVQFLLLIPLVVALQTWAQGGRPDRNRSAVAWGIGAIVLVALLLLLGIGKFVNDMFYMLPQGVFGAWLIVMNGRLSGRLPRWLRALGMVVGVGLLLVGTVFPGLATFVYPNMWKIPAVPVDDEVFVQSWINRALHLILAVGSLLGVVTLPVWTLFVGASLLGRRRFDSIDPI